VFDRADTPHLKVARVYRTARRGTVSVFDSHYLIADAKGVEQFTERQELGLFTPVQYRAVLKAAGLRPMPAGDDLFGYGLYVARKPAAVQVGRGRGRRSGT
jgi:dTDP-3-amino-3,4,6-trideoxy-alpha-D-glucopyranose N,N-dimethyltransferase/N-dimethyltransferase